jgi:hypothetical protein
MSKVKKAAKKVEPVPTGRFALRQSPKDPLYRRLADSACGQCSHVIGDAVFDVVFSEHDGKDTPIHDACNDAWEASEEGGGA